MKADPEDGGMAPFLPPELPGLDMEPKYQGDQEEAGSVPLPEACQDPATVTTEFNTSAKKERVSDWEGGREDGGRGRKPEALGDMIGIGATKRDRGE